MATQLEINAVLGSLQRLPGLVTACQEIARALLETKQPLSRADKPWGLIWGTDYDRARRQIIRQCGLTQSQLRRIRRTDLSPDAIRGQAEIEKIRRACRNCLLTNRKAMEEGRAFRCLADEQSRRPGKGFRFQLDPNGNIHGSV